VTLAPRAHERGPMNILHDELKRDLIDRGFSRRNFGRIAAMITAGATLPFYNEPALAQLSKVSAPPDAVLLNANENPLGPCKEAREAATGMAKPTGCNNSWPNRKASRRAMCGSMPVPALPCTRRYWRSRGRSVRW